MQTDSKIMQIGYLTGDSLLEAFHRGKSGRPLSQTIKIRDDLWYSISPDAIEFQFNRESEARGASSETVLLIDHPEVLKEALPDPETFYQSIAESMRFCETLAERKAIRSYGFASNRISTLTEILPDADLKNFRHFKTASSDLSIFNSDVLLLENFRSFEFLVRNSLRPSIHGQRVIISDEVDSEISVSETQAPSMGFISEKLEALKALEKIPSWASRIENQFYAIRDFSTWNELFTQQIEPALKASQLDSEYASKLRELADALTAYFRSIDRKNLKAMNDRLNDVWQAPLPFAQKCSALLSAYAKDCDVSLNFDLDPDVTQPALYALAPLQARDLLRELHS